MSDKTPYSALDLRIFALTSAMASILKHLPVAKAELLQIATALEDAPPIAVTDELLGSMAKEIRDVIDGKWKELPSSF